MDEEEKAAAVTLYREYSLTCDICTIMRQPKDRLTGVATLPLRGRRVITCKEHFTIVEVISAIDQWPDPPAVNDYRH